MAYAEDSLQARVEQTTKEYQDAAAEVERIEAEIAQNEEKAADIEERLPEQRARTAASIKSLYMFQQSSSGLLDLVLSADDFNDFISTIRYIDAIHERNATEVKALVDMEQELVVAQATLSADRDAAVAREEEARTALDEARAARQEVQAQANATAAAEAGRRAEAMAAVRETIEKGISKTASGGSSSQGSSSSSSSSSSSAGQQERQSSENNESEGGQQEATITTRSGNTTRVELPPEPDVSTDPIVDNTTSSEVSEWAARIDAYLEGSPLAGHGMTFAQAASDYGVDPRLSPAISCIESGKGAVCFLPHNAWGWGSASWDDWDSAIRGHISGFASIYGSTITLEGAEMYASNDIYAEWYALVLSEMSSI